MFEAKFSCRGILGNSIQSRLYRPKNIAFLFAKNICTKMDWFLLLICGIPKMTIEAELQAALEQNSKESVNRSFERIYDEYFKLGMFVALQYLNEHDSTDVVNDAFVNLFEKILKEKKCDIKNIKQYICVSIKNGALKKVRETKNTIAYDDDINYSNKNDIFLIDNLFAGLNKLEQIIITEHALLERKFKDIAKDLNKPLFTVTSIYRRGIQKIKRRTK